MIADARQNCQIETKKCYPPPRPNMPAAYSPKGVKPNFVRWSFAEERLSKSHNYWICSTRPDGRPHSAPVWQKMEQRSAAPPMLLDLISGDPSRGPGDRA